jgi:hypothetical protein
MGTMLVTPSTASWMFSLIVACCWLMTRSSDDVVGLVVCTGGESIWTSRVTVSASAERRLCRHKAEPYYEGTWLAMSPFESKYQPIEQASL